MEADHVVLQHDDPHSPSAILGIKAYKSFNISPPEFGRYIYFLRAPGTTTITSTWRPFELLSLASGHSRQRNDVYHPIPVCACLSIHN